MVDVSRGGEVKSIRAGHGDGTSCPFRYLDILTFLTLSEGILLRSVTGRVLGIVDGGRWGGRYIVGQHFPLQASHKLKARLSIEESSCSASLVRGG